MYICNSHCLVFLVSTCDVCDPSEVVCGYACMRAFSFKCFVSFNLCGVGFLFVFSRCVMSSLSPGLQNYFPQHKQCYFVQSFLRNRFPSQSICLLITVVLNLLVANWQD